MLCLSGFELYSRWVPLKYGRLSSLPAFWTKSDKRQLYSQARNMRVEHGEVIMFFRVALGAYFSRIARG